MDGLASQTLHHFRNVVLLKEADGGNASRARIEAGASVIERDTTQGKHGNRLPASFTQPVEAGGARLRGILLFEDWSKHREVSSLGACTSDIGDGMASDADQRAGRISSLRPNLSHFYRRNIVRPQMHSVRTTGYSNVCS